MREPTLVAAGFCAASVVSGALFAVFTYATDRSGIQGVPYMVASLVVGVWFSAITTALLGLPAFLVLKCFKLARWWSATATGFVIGATVAMKIEWPEAGFDLLNLQWTVSSVLKVVSLGAIGATSALVFWLVWKQGTTQ